MIQPEYFILFIAKSRNTAITARTRSSVSRAWRNRKILGERNTTRHWYVHVIRERNSEQFARSGKRRKCVHRRHLTLIASWPVRRCCFSWLRMMMKGRPYSSNATVPGIAVILAICRDPKRIDYFSKKLLPGWSWTPMIPSDDCLCSNNRYLRLATGKCRKWTNETRACVLQTLFTSQLRILYCCNKGCHETPPRGKEIRNIIKYRKHIF